MVLGGLGRTPGRFGRFTRSLAQGAGLAVVRFPVTALAIVAIAGISNLAVGGVLLLGEASLPWLLAALYAGGAAAVLATVAAESHRLKVQWRIGASLIAALFVGGSVWSGFRFGVYPPTLIAATTLAIPLGPFVGRPGPQRFWNFTFWTTVGTVLAFLSVMLFVAGFSAIVEMVRFLFAVGLPAEAYEYIFTTALTFVGPLFALGRIPRDFDEAVPLARDDRLISGVRILLDWVAMPMALATAVVLHLYAAKILFTGTLPTGEIGWIVSFFALLVLSLRVSADPFLDEAALPTRLFRKCFAAILVVPLALLCTALWLRVDGQGLTLQRYYLALGTLAAIIVVALQLVPRLRNDIRWMTAVPIALLALSAFGPWGAASSVGRSQATMIRQELPEPLSPEAVERLGDRRRAELRSRIYALDESGQIDRLGSLMSPDDRNLLAAALDSRPSDAVDVAFAAFGLSRPEPVASTARSFTAGGQGVIDISGFDRTAGERQVIEGQALVVHQRSGGSALPPRGVDVTLAGGQLVVRVDSVEDRFDLATAIAQLPDNTYSADPAGLVAPVVTLDSPTGRRIKLVITQAITDQSESFPSALASVAPSAQADPGTSAAAPKLVSARITLFYRAADWQDTPPNRN